ncbi:2123_t:CDS:2, partial [Racocetra persica]
PIYFQYFESKTIIKLSADSWEDFTQLHVHLEKTFGLKGSLIDYKFVISNNNIDFSWSKKDFQTTELTPSCFVDVKRSYTEMINGLPVPSTLGIPKEYTIPVSLYSSIFGKFKEFCMKDPEREDNQFTYDICYTMAKYYDKKEKRQDKTNEMLEEYLGYSVELLMIKRKDSDSNLKDARTDGTVSFSKHRVANLEYKSDDCCSNTSPYLENCSYYLVFCNEQANSSSNSPSSYVTNFPYFLVTIAVGNLVQNHSKDPSFPSFLNIIINNECYNVEIDCKIDDYLLWVVTHYNEQGPPKPKKACVKLLAEAGYAPKVLASLIIPENWLIVYIEYLKDYSILNYFASINERNHLREKIKEIVGYLHDAGHVHGDLREENILVCQLMNNDFDVKLIDFEWSRE